MTEQNTEQQLIQVEPQEMWAIVEIMGHSQTAGRISRSADWGGLIRVDVPAKDGGYNTEFFGMAAIFHVKPVSEEIARAFAPQDHLVESYNAPIVTREQHQATVNRLTGENRDLYSRIRELERRLTQIDAEALPAGEAVETIVDDHDDDFNNYDDEELEF